MPARAPASMLMLQIVMRPSIESARIAEPAYSTTQPVAPSVPILPMMARMMSFAVTPRGQLAFDGDAEGLRLRLRQRLRRQHVLHFAGADAEGQRSECAVRRCVRVAADDRHARLGDAQFRPDHVDDALLAAVDVVELDAEVRAIFAQRVNLRGRDLIDDVQTAFNRCGHIVIHGCDAAVRAADLAAGEAKSFECLRGSDLVQQLQIDVEQRRLALRL